MQAVSSWLQEHNKKNPDKISGLKLIKVSKLI